jgi:rhodanese-related sulfurtransferase
MSQNGTRDEMDQIDTDDGTNERRDGVRRRTLLASAAVAAGLAGCLDGGNGSSGDDETTESTRTGDGPGTSAANTEYETNGDFPADEGPPDGYPPEFDDVPEERTVDTDAFETTARDGVDVPLVPVDVAHYWYRRREARFADARGREQYDTSHVYGAVLSPVGYEGDGDPVADWPSGDRIVCYCGCPHHLSSIRAAALIDGGYEEVYVVDEGFWEWHERDYPMAGRDLSATPFERIVRGRTDARYAGETVWARHDQLGQRETTSIGSDGRFSVALRFVDVGPDDIVVVETPGYVVEAPLRQLVDTTVTADMA